jgi:hypothetical protein
MAAQGCGCFIIEDYGLPRHVSVVRLLSRWPVITCVALSLFACVVAGCNRCTNFSNLPPLSGRSDTNEIVAAMVRHKAKDEAERYKPKVFNFPLEPALQVDAAIQIDETQWIVAAHKGTRDNPSELFEIQATNVVRKLPNGSGAFIEEIQIASKEPLTLLMDTVQMSPRVSVAVWLYDVETGESAKILPDAIRTKISPSGARIAWGYASVEHEKVEIYDRSTKKSTKALTVCNAKGESGTQAPSYFWLNDTNLVCYGSSEGRGFRVLFDTSSRELFSF